MNLSMNEIFLYQSDRDLCVLIHMMPPSLKLCVFDWSRPFTRLSRLLHSISTLVEACVILLMLRLVVNYSMLLDHNTDKYRLINIEFHC